MPDQDFESDMGASRQAPGQTQGTGQAEVSQPQYQQEARPDYDQGEFHQGQYEQGMGSGRPPGEEGIFPGHHHKQHEHEKKEGEEGGEKKEGLLKKVENIFHKDKK